MNWNEKAYEIPMAMIYRFDNNNQILTASGGEVETPITDYAARALNDFMGGTNTTIE